MGIFSSSRRTDAQEVLPGFFPHQLQDTQHKGKSGVTKRHHNREVRRELQLEIDCTGHEGKSECGHDPSHKETRSQFFAPEMFRAEETAVEITRNLEHFTKEPCFQ